MEVLPNDVAQYIFTFVGFWSELTKMRLVCRHFKHVISWRCITGLVVKKSNVCLLSIKKITNRLIYLKCIYNKLTSLPDLPNNKHLECNSNNLTHLPDLPNNTYLDCSNNQLTILTVLPTTLGLFFSANNFT